MSLPDNLAQKIDDTRITYPQTEVGVRIEGAPFICEFNTPTNPESVCDTLRTTEEPWRMFGIKNKLADEQRDDDGEIVQSAYWKLLGTLFHVEGDELVGASSVTLELTSNWCRVYVKEDCSADRVAEFVRALNDEYGISVQFNSETSELDEDTINSSNDYE